MARTSKRFFFIILCGYLLGTTFGWLARSHFIEPTHGISSSEVRPNPITEGLTGSHELIPPSRTGSVSASLEQTDLKTTDYNALLTFLERRNLQVIPRTKLHDFAFNIPFGVVTRAGKVSTQIAEILQIAPEQVDRLNESMATAAERLAQLDLAGVRVEQKSDLHVVMRLEANPAEADEVVSALKRDVRNTLGPRLGSVFWEVMAASDSYWVGFGRKPVTIEFSVIPGDDAYWTISEFGDDINDLRARSAFKDFGLHHNGEIPPARYKHLIPLLPPEMQSLFSSNAP